MRNLRTVFRTDVYDDCVAFYRDVLGLEIAEQWDSPAGSGCMFAFAGGLVEFYGGDRLESGVQLMVEVDDVDAEFARLTAAGAEPEEPIVMPWGHRSVFVTDPHGTRINFYEDPEARNSDG